MVKTGGALIEDNVSSSQLAVSGVTLKPSKRNPKGPKSSLTIQLEGAASPNLRVAVMAYEFMPAE